MCQAPGQVHHVPEPTDIHDNPGGYGVPVAVMRKLRGEMACSRSPGLALIWQAE